MPAGDGYMSGLTGEHSTSCHYLTETGPCLFAPMGGHAIVRQKGHYTNETNVCYYAGSGPIHCQMRSLGDGVPVVVSGCGQYSRIFELVLERRRSEVDGCGLR
jgi:hypothetical protein